MPRSDHTKVCNDGSPNDAPRDVTMPRVLNKRSDTIPDGAVYVGRPTKWGNLFVIGRHGDRDEVIRRFQEWLLASPELMAQLDELKDRDLVCWCAPLPCHAQILIELATTGRKRFTDSVRDDVGAHPWASPCLLAAFLRS